ncbi:unnamed protein product, partial [Discosporangium mesarthrocarpum]
MSFAKRDNATPVPQGKRRGARDDVTPAKRGAEASAGSGPKDVYLFATAGTNALTDHYKDKQQGSNMPKRVEAWPKKASLGLPLVEPALGFLDVLGLSRKEVYKSLLENALQKLLDKIPQLDEEIKHQLLTDSFRWCSRPDLKSVPLKIISSMSTVPEQILGKIVELQDANAAEFENLGLPMGVKRLAWETDRKLFGKVILPHLNSYMKSEYIPKLALGSSQIRKYKPLETSKRRRAMADLGIKSLADCVGGRPILIGYVCDQVADCYGSDASASGLTGLWCTLLTDALLTFWERALGQVAERATDKLCALAARLDQAVRENSFGDGATRDVQRLFREATMADTEGPEGDGGVKA